MPTTRRGSSARSAAEPPAHQLRCARCGATAAASDAVGLGNGLVLAEFPAACQHAPGRVMILTLTWCTAPTAAGELCQWRAKADGLCGVHLAQRAARARSATELAP
jgi:hypothetical protein